MPIGQTTRSTANSPDIHRPIVLISIDDEDNYFRLSSWLSRFAGSGGEAGETEYKYFEGDAEVSIDAPGAQTWEGTGRYSEGDDEPFRNLYAHFIDGTLGRRIFIKWFRSDAIATDLGWKISGKLLYVSPPTDIDANSSNVNTFTFRVSGTMAEYTVAAGDLTNPPT